MTAGYFSNLDVKSKIYGVVGLCLPALAAISGFAVWRIDRIGREIESIAEQDIPLTLDLTEISSHQLEQTIQLERMLRFAPLAQSNAHAGEAYRHALENFFYKLKEFKRVAMRCDKTDTSFTGMIYLCSTVIISR